MSLTSPEHSSATAPCVQRASSRSAPSKSTPPAVARLSQRQPACGRAQLAPKHSLGVAKRSMSSPSPRAGPREDAAGLEKRQGSLVAAEPLQTSAGRALGWDGSFPLRGAALILSDCRCFWLPGSGAEQQKGRPPTRRGPGDPDGPFPMAARTCHVARAAPGGSGAGVGPETEPISPSTDTDRTRCSGQITAGDPEPAAATPSPSATPAQRVSHIRAGTDDSCI